MFQSDLLAARRVLVTGGGTGLGEAMARRFAALRFFGAPGVIALVASLIIAVCCRLASAVQKPRTGPAALFAALSHMLMKGFFI
jgi:NAD(P)-dependent dehydrogenase (short-subunit alcohol dehydrogenase family)